MKDPHDKTTGIPEGPTSAHRPEDSSAEMDVRVPVFTPCPAPAPVVSEAVRRRRGRRTVVLLLLLAILLVGVWAATVLMFGTLYSTKGAAKEYRSLLAERTALAGRDASDPAWAEFQTRSRRIASLYADRFRRSASAQRPGHVKLLEISETLWPKLLECGTKTDCEAESQIAKRLDEIDAIDKADVVK
jgi:hypothetical protein